MVCFPLKWYVGNNLKIIIYKQIACSGARFLEVCAVRKYRVINNCIPSKCCDHDAAKLMPAFKLGKVKCVQGVRDKSYGGLQLVKLTKLS